MYRRDASWFEQLGWLVHFLTYQYIFLYSATCAVALVPFFCPHMVHLNHCMNYEYIGPCDHKVYS